jgi:alanine racemase
VGLVHHIPSRETALTYTVGGRQVPVLLDHGTVLTLDLSGVPEAAAGDEVVIDFSAETFHMLDATAPLPVTTTGG